MKALGLVVLDKNIFENCNWQNLFFDPRDLLMQPIRTIWTIFTIFVEFGRIPISGSREEVVWTFPYIIQRGARTLNCSTKKYQRAITLKLESGWLWFLCSALLLNEICTPLKFHVQICYSLWDKDQTSLWRPDGQRQIYILPPSRAEKNSQMISIHVSGLSIHVIEWSQPAVGTQYSGFSDGTQYGELLFSFLIRKSKNLY